MKYIILIMTMAAILSLFFKWWDYTPQIPPPQDQGDSVNDTFLFSRHGHEAKIIITARASEWLMSTPGFLAMDDSCHFFEALNDTIGIYLFYRENRWAEWAPKDHSVIPDTIMLPSGIVEVRPGHGNVPLYQVDSDQYYRGELVERRALQ